MTTTPGIYSFVNSRTSASTTQMLSCSGLRKVLEDYTFTSHVVYKYSFPVCMLPLPFADDVPQCSKVFILKFRLICFSFIACVSSLIAKK